MIKKKIYKNGATLIFRKNRRKCTSVVAGFLIGKNRDNYPEPTAHFCEHMFFNETESKTKSQLKTAMQETFSNYNGRTGLFYTEIDFMRSNKALSPCFSLASEMLLNTKFSNSIIKNEKGVIKQELVRKLNDPNSISYFTFARCTQDNYNKNSMVLGSNEEIDAITPKILKQFKNETFISQNFLISIEGGISWWKAKRLAEKHFIKKLNNNPNYPIDRTVIVKTTKAGNLLIENYPFKKSICHIGILIDEELNTLKNKATANMLCSVCSRMTGKLVAKLRENGLVYSARMSNDFSPVEAMLHIDFECSSDNVNLVINQIGNTFDDLRKNLIDEKIIDKKKENTKYEQDESQQFIYPSNLWRRYLIDGEKVFSRKYKKEYKKFFQETTAQELQDFCNIVLTKPDNIYVAILSDSTAEKFYTYNEIQDIMTKNKKPRKIKTKQADNNESIYNTKPLQKNQINKK